MRTKGNIINEITLLSLIAEPNMVEFGDSFRSGGGQVRYSLLEAGQITLQDGVPAGWQTNALQCR